MIKKSCQQNKVTFDGNLNLHERTKDTRNSNGVGKCSDFNYLDFFKS